MGILVSRTNRSVIPKSMCFSNYDRLSINKKCRIENVDLSDIATDAHMTIMKKLPLRALNVSNSSITNNGLSKAVDYW